MDKLEELTKIELNNLINKTKDNHEMIKHEIEKYLEEIDNLDEKVNLKIKKLDEVENQYVKLIDVLLSKK